MAIIAEYGQIQGQAMSVDTILKSVDKTLWNGKVRTYNLVHTSPGWTSAGSMARMVETESYRVLFYADGAQNGRGFKTLEEAERMLAIWTAAE